MKKPTKIALVIGLGLMSIAIIISAFNFGSLLSPIYENTNYEEINKEFAPDEINTIYVDSANEKVTISVTDSNVIKVKYYISDNDKYNLEINNNTLSLKKERNFKFFSFNFHFWSTNKIEIEIPVNIVLGYNINTSNGSIEIKDLEIDSSSFDTSNAFISLENIISKDKVSLSTSNGYINVDNAAVEGIEVKTSNGAISFKDTLSNNINIKTSNGRIELDSLITKYIKAETSNGKISFNDLESPVIDLKSSNGRIEGSISGIEKDYHKDMRTSNSKIIINNQEYGTKVFDSNEKENSIKAKTSNGGIYIDFK